LEVLLDVVRMDADCEWILTGKTQNQTLMTMKSDESPKTCQNLIDQVSCKMNFALAP